MCLNDILVIIPAYNEEQKIGQVVYRLMEAGFNNILVVDDGSSDNTGEISCNMGVSVLYHYTNLGLGGALRTGIEFAMRRDFRHIHTG